MEYVGVDYVTPEWQTSEGMAREASEILFVTVYDRR